MNMNITSAKFVKGIVEADEILDDGLPQIAFLGRSNVGKSSVINSLANKKDLAKTSSFPGRTRQDMCRRLKSSNYWRHSKRRPA